MLNDSSKELLDSINALKKSMDTMLKLFTEAAEEIKAEGSEGPAEISSMNEKLDKILDQNREIIEMIGDFAEKQKKTLPHEPILRPNFRPSSRPKPDFQQPPRFQESLNELESQHPSQPQRPRHQGPVAMPSVSFPSFKEPKKKGLFGRLRP